MCIIRHISLPDVEVEDVVLGEEHPGQAHEEGEPEGDERADRLRHRLHLAGAVPEGEKREGNLNLPFLILNPP